MHTESPVLCPWMEKRLCPLTSPHVHSAMPQPYHPTAFPSSGVSHWLTLQHWDPVPTERRLLHKNGSSFYPGDVQILTGHTRNMERK
ncbi:mCG145670 [Mus musculus]|nr:mCG144781 [Mus musculus]EDK96911.1 mCG145670 [Mus musculus]